MRSVAREKVAKREGKRKDGCAEGTIRGRR